MTIHGAKKGSSKQRQPVIAPDSAQSKTYIKMLYGLGEGEIAGLANGYKSVYLDDTPLQNDDGEFNFPNVKVDFRAGTNDQEYIDGFADVASETNVGVELKHGTPWVKSFNNLDLDAVRVRLKWGALRSQNSDNGDVSGVKIDYAIDVKTDNGGWVQALNTSINAKTSNAYERSHRIDLPKAGTGWAVRVRRITPNSTSEFVSDKMYVSAITEVIDLKLRYPNTALLGLRYDAEQFSNVAKMAARCRGLIIKVPTNYNPITRTYDGLWDGEFKMAYTNNPAWVYYDLCTAERYGLGSRLTQSMIDKWSLYRLAQYCDQMVDDGMGGQEPRFTVNVYIQSADGAFELLSRLAGVFRAISYWDGTSIVLDADIPQDSIYSFSRANVIDGVFEYTGTRARDRHTVAKVAWDNPANHFKTEYEYVRDEKAIAKFGVRVADIQAWGCTSKGQAQRAGLWALKSEQLETRMVTFKVGLDGYIPAPAKVIEISDELFAGRATGGRVLAINKTKTVITLDRAITAKAGDTLVINGDDGTSQRRQIRSVSGDKITVTKAFGDISEQNVWVLDSQDLATMRFRVLSVTADDNHQFTITAVQYSPAKYDAIDTGAYTPERPISVINPTVQAPTKSVNLSSYHTVNQGVSITTLVIGWEQVTGAVKYIVQWRKDNGNWQTLPPTGTNSIEVTGVYAGAYEARVTAISAFGQASLATHSNLTQIQGKQGKPPRPINLTAQGVLFGMNLGWNFAHGSDDTNYTEIEVSPDGRTHITTLGTFAYPTNKHEITGLQGNLTQFYRARIVDKLGNTSDWTDWVSGTTSADADKVLDILSGQISQSHLDQSLRTPIGKIGTIESKISGINRKIPTLESNINSFNSKIPSINKIPTIESAVNSVNGNLSTLNSQLATAQNELSTAKSTLQTAVSNIATERNRITSAIRDITALQSANNAKTQEIANLTQTVGSHTSSIRELGVTTGDLSQKYSQIKTQADNTNSEISTIKQTQSGQASSIDRLGARFDNLAVGGRNLLLNTQNPTYYRWANRGILSNTRLDINAVDNDTSIGIFTGYQNLNLKQGQDYVISFDVDTDLLSLNYNYILGIDGNIRLPSSNIKQGRVVIKYTPSRDLNNVRLLIGGFKTAEASYLDVKNIKLERGNIATDWTEAPEDLQVDLSPYATSANLDEFKQTQADKDTALAQQITALDTAYKSADRTLTANLASETTVRTNADNALTQRINSLTADYNGNKASVANQLKTLSDKDTATASQISQLTANVTTAQNTANTANGKADTATTKADNAQNMANNALTRANTANSAITAEQRARADADTALGQRITAIDTAYKQADTATNAKLATAEKAISDTNQALSQRINTLDAQYKKADKDLTARLAREETARATGDTANSQAIRTLESTVQGVSGRVGTSESKIATLERTTSDTNQALATAQSQMNARFDSLSVGGRNLLFNTANFSKYSSYNNRARYANMDSFGRIDTISSGHVGILVHTKSTHTIHKNEQAVLSFEYRTDMPNLLYTYIINDNHNWRIVPIHSVVNDGQWQKAIMGFTAPKDLTNVRALMGAMSAPVGSYLEIRNIKLERGNIATDWTQAPEDLQVDLSPYATSANLDEFKQTQADKDTATAQKLSKLQSDIGTKANTAALNSLTTKVNQTDGKITAQTQRLNTLQSSVSGNTSSINTLSQSLTTKERALSEQINTAKSELGGRITQISNETRTLSNANRTVGEQINTVQTTVQGQTASIRNVERSVNGVRSIKAVTVDNNGFISGYGLMSDLQNGRVTSRFGINADQIYFGTTTNAKKPFVFTTKATTIDGVSYPAGAWLNSASIAHASINMLHIADSIQSDNYVAGRQGWRLFKDGRFELNNTFGDGSSLELNSQGLTVWYDKAQGKKAVELGILL
ncbi:TipJ family phage tail tip protein [Moraxella nonliquefaciens]|uniref:TipJ family phage tail tip protein n=3 Tax=Moraxella nonliquefaciens TaxID=478 RepID=UPI0024A7540D|nr:phage tail protein [Moraxella nonliquefaciens]